MVDISLERRIQQDVQYFKCDSPFGFSIPVRMVILGAVYLEDRNLLFLKKIIIVFDDC